jgi:predicted transcriptional regulator
MNTIDQNVVATLKSISAKQLRFVERVINRAITKKVSINEAIKAEQYTKGDKVMYLTKSGEIHQAVVQKVNQVRINIYDKKEKVFVDVYPDQISPPEVSEMIVEKTAKRKPGRPKKAETMQAATA